MNLITSRYRKLFSNPLARDMRQGSGRAYVRHVCPLPAPSAFFDAPLQCRTGMVEICATKRKKERERAEKTWELLKRTGKKSSSSSGFIRRILALLKCKSPC